MVGTAATAGMVGTAAAVHIAPQTGFFTGTLSLNIQGTLFQGAYMPNPSFQFSPNLPLCAQITQLAILTQREQILQDQRKREHQQFEAWKLEVENKTLALQSRVIEP